MKNQIRGEKTKKVISKITTMKHIVKNKGEIK
jgi:hypothetical protein